MQRLYLYLASRSKQGIKLVTILQSEKSVCGRLESLEELKLPLAWQRQISQIIHDHRMLYEPMVETAKDFNDLRQTLKHRGYSNIPMGATPLLDFKAYIKAPVADASSVKVRRTMIRKNRNGR